tara:strand:+ start:818 stop:1006 length:189 start_codon:yes stop_codon:yes gene_type:complete
MTKNETKSVYFRGADCWVEVDGDVSLEHLCAALQQSGYRIVSRPTNGQVKTNGLKVEEIRNA